MTYDAIELSEQSGRPVEVYRFAVASETYDYTSAEDEVTVGGITYSPRAIVRGSFQRGPDERARPLSVTLPVDDAYVRRFVGIPPGQRTTLTIRRYHRNDGATPEMRLAFKGFVQSVRFTEDVISAVLAAYTLEGRLGNEMPKFTFANSCGHFLYDDGCGVDEDDPANKLSSVVTAVSGSTITVAGAGAFNGGNRFPAGFVRAPGFDEQRQILGQSSDVLELMLPFPVSVVGSSVDVYSGCDHLATGHCSTRYANVPRIQGWPFVPKKNIFATGLD